MNKFIPLPLRNMIGRLKSVLYGDIITAVDIGTSKVIAVIAKVKDDDLEILGYGISKARGLENGAITDLEEASISLERAVKEAQASADTQVSSAIINISGNHIKSHTLKASINVSQFPREITIEDKLKLEKSVESKLFQPADRVTLYRVAYNYIIDEINPVMNPVGMIGTRLTANLHVVTGKANLVDSILRCCSNVGLEVNDMVVDGLASSYSVLSYTERKMGSLIIDVGGSITNVALIKGGKFIYTAVVPVGAEHFTNDIAAVLNIDFKTAEYIKQNLKNLAESSEQGSVEISFAGSPEKKKVNLNYIKSIIEARAYELVELMLRDTELPGLLSEIQGSVVLIGGGSRTLFLKEEIERVLSIHTRVGMIMTDVDFPEELRDCGAENVVGLLMYKLQKLIHSRTSIEKTMTLSGIFVRIKEALKSCFG